MTQMGLNYLQHLENQTHNRETERQGKENLKQGWAKVSQGWESARQGREKLEQGWEEVSQQWEKIVQGDRDLERKDAEYTAKLYRDYQQILQQAYNAARMGALSEAESYLVLLADYAKAMPPDIFEDNWLEQDKEGVYNTYYKVGVSNPDYSEHGYVSSGRQVASGWETIARWLGLSTPGGKGSTSGNIVETVDGLVKHLP